MTWTTVDRQTTAYTLQVPVEAGDYVLLGYVENDYIAIELNVLWDAAGTASTTWTPA